MARNQRKQSDYEESYHESDFDYDVACAEDEAENWGEDDDYGESGDSEGVPHRRRPRSGQGGRVFTARSVGRRESTGSRKKLPPPSLVRPPARKPHPSTRPVRESQRDRRTPQREREQPYHGPHFLDKPRRGQPEPLRPASLSAPPALSPTRNAKSAKRDSGWRRFLLLVVLLACGTAYTFYATTNQPTEGNAHNHSESSVGEPSQNALPNGHADDDSDADVSATQNTVSMRFSENVTPDSPTFVTPDLPREFQFHLQSYTTEEEPESSDNT